MNTISAFVVDRSKLITSRLFTEDGCGCVLGHFYLAHNNNEGEKQLSDADVYEYLHDLYPSEDGQFIDNCWRINDRRRDFKWATNEEREQSLIEHFATRGITLTFTGNYV